MSTTNTGDPAVVPPVTNPPVVAAVPPTAGGTANPPAPQNAGATGPDGSKWDEETTAYIKQLRTESADRRTKNKELTDSVSALKTQFGDMQSGIAKALGLKSDLTPEQQLEQATAQTQDLQTQNFMLQTMMEKGIGKDQSDYFSFLVEKKAGSLGENEDMTDDMLNDIVTEVQKVSGQRQGATSVTTQQTNGTAPNAGTGASEVDVAAFAGMNISEKSALYAKSPEQYNSLMSQARQQNLI